MNTQKPFALDKRGWPLWWLEAYFLQGGEQMTKDVYLNLHGLDLVVTVEYEDNAVCGVESVRPEGSQMSLKCDIARFYTVFHLKNLLLQSLVLSL